MKNNLIVEDWGQIEYLNAYQRQKQIVNDVVGGAPGRLIFCEHPTVITLGRMTKADSLLYTKENIQAVGIDIHAIDRGGDVTMHTPGQLVVYVIMDLNNYNKDLKLYMQCLEQVAVDLLKDFGILAMSLEGKRGVFVGLQKIVSIGVGVRKWVTFHGLGINVYNDLNLYRFIKPCGLNVEMTSMQKLSKNNITMKEVIDSFKKNFNQRFEAL